MEYKELNLHQHVLHRPDTYIGAIHPQTRQEFVFIDESITKKTIEIIPAIERLFVEALSNAIDNFARSKEHSIECTAIKITIEGNRISIWNNGMWIPNRKNDNGVWIPQMIFGQLLTSSNYNDEEERYTSGRNGIGIKAVNIFSKEFSIECEDKTEQTVYCQTWTNNMNQMSKPIVRKRTKATGYTMVSWTTDFNYFGQEGYDENMVSLLTRHILDTAMITQLDIFLNAKKIPIRKFKDYVKLYTSSKEYLEFSHEKYSIAIIPSPTQSFEFMSFVNGIHTIDGGVHVDHTIDTILKPLLKELQKKIKTKFSLKDIKPFFMIIVSCSLPNPTFSNQSKTRLTSPHIQFSIQEDDVKPMLRWSFVQQLREQMELKENGELKKTERKRGYISIPNYDPAHKSGTKDSSKCTLILCEGLSAKTYAIQGIHSGIDFGSPLGFIQGKDWYGVLPLRGKCFSKGTKVMMMNRRATNIEDLIVGDSVMGDDNTFRVVEDTITGEDLMYTISQSFGESYTVTQDHLLVLRSVFKWSIEWDMEHHRWEVQYFDTNRLRIQTTHVQCFNPNITYDRELPLPMEEAYEAILKSFKQLKMPRYFHIFVSDYLELDDSVRHILRGVRRIRGKVVDTVLTISKVGVQQFYGIQIDNNHRFCLGDGTIVHNCLNARNATKQSIAGNTEITNLIQSLGLRYGTDYSRDDEFKTLRYGRIMNLVDSDTDGKHIEGLIMNIFHYLFPSLLNRSGFFMSMKTPIMKIEYRSKIERFYEMELAKKFIDNNPNANLKIRYYKGLGASTNEDIVETFGQRVVEYIDLENSTQSMNLVFHKSYADQRKEWLRQPIENIPTNQKNNVISTMSLSDFLRNEMVLFSLEDCYRNLPCLLDGFKESHRKILFACFLKNITLIKVAQLGGYVAEKTNYHHGEQCLFDTIIKMSQDFVGSNNIPLLLKQGMVGTRLHLGKDASSARYVSVQMGEKTRYLFPKEDDGILPIVMDEGIEIEPKYYLPIIPMLLVNGSEGIGTGWSCSVPSYNPSDLVKWIVAWLDKKPTPQLIPWYNGFLGTIVQQSHHKFVSTGVMKRTKENRVVITEIPIGMSIDRFKEFCEELVIEKKIKEYENHSTPDKIFFELTEFKEGIRLSMDNLKLSSIISTTNLVVLNKENAIKKYDTIDELFEEFCKHRFDGYTLRKQNQLKVCQEEHDLVYNRLRFLKKVMGDEIVVYKTPMGELEKILGTNKFLRVDNSYSYLLDMPIKNFTKQKLTELMNKVEELDKKIEYWKKVHEEELWKTDLNKLN